MTMRINSDGGVRQTRAPAKSEATQAVERPQSSPTARNQIVDSFEARGRVFDKLLGESRALNGTAPGAQAPDQLAQELTKLGPALTDEQKQKYIQEFREKCADEYGAEEAAAKDLNAALNDLKLLEAARANPDVAAPGARSSGADAPPRV